MSNDTPALVIPAAFGAYILDQEELETIQELSSTVRAMAHTNPSVTIELTSDNQNRRPPQFLIEAPGLDGKLTDCLPATADDAEVLPSIRLKFDRNGVSLTVPEGTDYPGAAVGYEKIWQDCAEFSPLARLMTDQNALEDTIAGHCLQGDDIEMGPNYEVVELEDDTIGVWVASRTWVSFDRDELDAHRAPARAPDPVADSTELGM